MINNKIPLSSLKEFIRPSSFVCDISNMLLPVLSHHQGKWCKTMKITVGFDLYHTRINNGILYKIIITDSS
jgi:hypothetical protein